MGILTGEWWSRAAVRALKTWAQTMVALAGTGAVGVSDLDLPRMLSVSAVSAALSLLTSLAGLPEVEGGEPDGR